MARHALVPSIPRAPATPAQRALGEGSSDGRRSQPPASLASDALPMHAVLALVDRLLVDDEGAFLTGWFELQVAGRGRVDSSLAVRVVRAYREAGQLDRARAIAALLPPAPPAWSALDTARLGIERAILATHEGRTEQADAELRHASRSLGAAERGAGLRETLELHVAAARLDLRLGRDAEAFEALHLAEHVVERIDDGPWRGRAALTLGELSLRLNAPRAAVGHFVLGLRCVAPTSPLAASIEAGLAIALGALGSADEARAHARAAVAAALEQGAVQHAEAFDVLALVEIEADRPLAALAAVDEALAALGESEQPLLRMQLAAHRCWALAMAGRADAAVQALGKLERLCERAGIIDPLDAQELVATRTRVFEAAGKLAEAAALAEPRLGALAESFVTGTLNLTYARIMLRLGNDREARRAVERAALVGDRRGWSFFDRAVSRDLWSVALVAGDSRVVRYAERMCAADSTSPLPSTLHRDPLPPPSSRRSARLLPIDAEPNAADDDAALEGETLIYVTTLRGVSRVRVAELGAAVEGARVVVDTVRHALRVDGREISVERRRALEPLVVQVLRRAKEGLTAEEVLRAAGGPGPESADAEHRVRVLISRIRDLLGDPALIERMRDAGEHGRTRYRLALGVSFALIEPLFPVA